MKERTVLRARQTIIRTVLSILVTAFVYGCGEVVPPKPVDNWSERSASPVVAEVSDDKLSFGAGTEIKDEEPSRLPPGANRVMKADAYWKLRALISGLKEENVSEDLAIGLEETKKLINQTDDDEFKPG